MKTRLRLRVKLWERKIEQLKEDQAKYGAWYTKEELDDDKIRNVYGTRMTAYKYAIFKLQKEMETWKKMLKGEFNTSPTPLPSPAPSSVETLEPVSS